MSKTFRNDLTGQRFGRLTVLEFVPTDDRNSCWKCQCDCGKIKIVRAPDLNSGRTKSCGCLRKELASKNNTIHGKAHTKLHEVWKGIKARSYNINDKEYQHYGGRGITVCDEWRNDFMSFYDWAMANGYSDTLTIDRIDNDGNYEPLNCQWVTMKEQARNKRNNIVIEYKGQQMCLPEAAEASRMSYNTLKHRYYRGDRGERLFRPIEK